MGRKLNQSGSGNWLIPVSTTAPAAAAAAAPAAGPPLISNPIPQNGGLDQLSLLIMTMNSNPYIIGMFMLLLNLGGRFLSLELTKKQEAFLQAPWIRPLIFFTVIFISTRNLVAAFWITILFFFIIWVVANENSQYCMIPSWCGDDQAQLSTNYTKNVEKLHSVEKN
jgi:hypothetical protein